MSFAFFQIWKRGNYFDFGFIKVLIAKSMGRLEMKPYANLLGAYLVREETELLFKACINSNTFGHFNRDSIVLM